MRELLERLRTACETGLQVCIKPELRGDGDSSRHPMGLFGNTVGKSLLLPALHNIFQSWCNVTRKTFEEAAHESSVSTRVFCPRTFGARNGEAQHVPDQAGGRQGRYRLYGTHTPCIKLRYCDCVQDYSRTILSKALESQQTRL